MIFAKTEEFSTQRGKLVLGENAKISGIFHVKVKTKKWEKMRKSVGFSGNESDDLKAKAIRAKIIRIFPEL